MNETPFDKAIREAEERLYAQAMITNNLVVPKLIYEPEPKEEEKEEWIWVEGYKGTDKDMKCRDYQFKLGKEHYHEGDVGICHSGFHFCLTAESVFRHYELGHFHRFFKIRALVKKSDYEELSKDLENIYDTKMTSKAIVFEYELEPRDVIGHYITFQKRCLDGKLGISRIGYIDELKLLENATDDDMDFIFEYGVRRFYEKSMVKLLMEDGYSEAVANYLCFDLDMFAVAHAFGKQKDMSMDAKILAIFKHIDMLNNRRNRRGF